jgi:hypothetical protein
MPIDPMIVAGIRPPAFEAPGTAYQRQQAITAGDLVNGLHQEQLTQAKLSTTQAQQAAFDDSRMRDLYSQSVGPNGQLDLGKLRSGLYSIDPKHGMAFDKSQTEVQKALAETQVKQLEADKTKTALIGDTLATIKDEATKNNAVANLVSRGLIDPKTGQQYLSRAYDPAFQAEIGQAAQAAMSRKDQLDAQQKTAEQKLREQTEARQQAESDARKPAIIAEGQAKQATVAGQTIGGVNDPASYAQWLSQQPADVQQFWGPDYSPAKAAAIARAGMSANERATQEGNAATRIETTRHNKAGESAIQQRLNLEHAKFNAERGNSGELVNAVMDNPALWDGLTPTARTSIAPELAKAGFSGFGKPLAEGAITKLSDSRSAISSLKDLRTTLQENEQYIGPVSGLQALNPYSEARKAQAKIDLVKQRVGKALEGGVLRKEDEEKYKKILATLQDTPTNAIAKVDQVIDSLQRDLDTFIEEQRRAGRKVNTTGSVSATGGRPPLSTFEGK